MMWFLIIVIFYCSVKTFPAHFWNHVRKESKVPYSGFTHICRRYFSFGVVMPKQLDAAGFSSACFHSPSVLQVDNTPAWSRMSLVRSSAISDAGGVG